ncbi:MAG: family 20 glycosylhydrolase [Steroidobacteraceae bacterium]
MAGAGLKWIGIAALAGALAALAAAAKAAPQAVTSLSGPPAAVAAMGAALAGQRTEAPDTTVDVVPQPAYVQPQPGVFEIRAGTRLSAYGDVRAARIARYFADLLRRTRGMALEVAARQGAAGSARSIVFRIDGHSAANPEAYTLNILPDHIELSAGDQRGLLYAAVTLWQLCTSDLSHVDLITVPAMRIADEPRFAWRGLMLDSARHYQPPRFILRLLDWMALHKLNRLQWHLTDDQGWRLQIRKYPRLATTGGWRVPAGAGPASDIDPRTGRPRLYGGFYSQQTVRRIVAHAAQRNVTIVPEIDMPGHATAAIVAYPWLATSQPAPRTIPSDWGVYPNLYNVEESTFAFLQNVLAEVIELFPGTYVDIGGDEAVKDQWKASPRVQARMRELGIADEQHLQSYFIGHMEKFLNARGRRLVGWDEILEGGIAPGATVMSWRGIAGTLAAAAAGHDSVSSPSPTLYFDYRQGNPPAEPPGRGRVVPLEEVYRFNPVPAALPEDQRFHVLGLQGNIWTEHIRTTERVEYMTFPRAAAVAEVGWSPAQKLRWEGFLARLPAQMSRYRALDLHASDDVFAIAVEPRLERARERVEVRLSNQAHSGQIHYTLDGTEPTVTSPQYGGPLDLPLRGEIRASAFAGAHALASPAARSLELASLQRRSSHELKSCTSNLVLSLEDDAPVAGKRAIYLVDIMNPCWVYEAADLTHVTAITAAVGQVPFNFQLGADVHSIKLREPRSAYGELEVRIDGCEGEPVAILPLAPAVANSAVTQLPAASIAHRDGSHDLCFRFTQHSLDPLWVLDWVQLRE